GKDRGFAERGSFHSAKLKRNVAGSGQCGWSELGRRGLRFGATPDDRQHQPFGGLDEADPASGIWQRSKKRPGQSHLWRVRRSGSGGVRNVPDVYVFTERGAVQCSALGDDGSGGSIYRKNCVECAAGNAAAWKKHRLN